LKAGGKAACKGLVGIDAKLIEKHITENKIVKKLLKTTIKLEMLKNCNQCWSLSTKISFGFYGFRKIN
jgi:hypothetical protein